MRTPEFADITFHEVHAKSALNQIDPARGLPLHEVLEPGTPSPRALLDLIGGHRVRRTCVQRQTL